LTAGRLTAVIFISLDFWSLFGMMVGLGLDGHFAMEGMLACA
jgi:hypothetical protein